MEGTAIARMLCDRNNVRDIYIVEIDGEVVNVSRKYFLSILNLHREIAKITLIIQNGEKFIKENQEKFDCIIIDSTDPVDNASIDI